MDNKLIFERIIEVPIDAIAPNLLHNMLEEFVSRDGTDYGDTEKPLSQKVEDLMMQLKLGKIKIFYDTDTEYVDILPADYIKRNQE